MKRLVAFVALLSIFSLFAGLAYAQTVPVAPVAAPTDVSTLLTDLLKGISAAVLGILSWASVLAGNWLLTHQKVLKAQQIQLGQQTFNTMMARGMAYADQWVASHYIDNDGNAVVNNQYLKVVAGFVRQFWPDLTSKLDDAAIAKATVARLPTVTDNVQAEITAQGAGAPTPVS